MSEPFNKKLFPNSPSRIKYFCCTVYLLLCKIHLCLTFSDENHIVQNEMNIPSLNTICSQNDLARHSMDYDSNIMDYLKIMPDYKNNTNITDSPRAANLNQTLDNILQLCLDHLSGSKQKDTPRKNDNSENVSKSNLRSETKEILSMLPSGDETNDAYFDQTEMIISDPEWLTMLKEFDILAEVVKNKSNLLENELNINYTDTSTLGNNTFLKSAITLYDTFINHYNLSGIPVHHTNNGTLHPFDDIDENDNGILFHHTSILSSANSNWAKGRQWANLSTEEQYKYLEEALGPQHKSGEKKVVIPTIIYSAISILGIPGNILTCLTIITNSYLKTPPNYFIFNLAAVDLVTLIIVIPMEILLFWRNYPIPFGEVGCDLAIVISELVNYVSILTMIAFTIERYIAICHPLKRKWHFGKRRTILSIFTIWIFSLIPSCCWTEFTNVVYIYYNPWEKHVRDTVEKEDELLGSHFVRVEDSSMCVLSQQSVTTSMIALVVLTTILLYLMPILILPWVYTRISNALKESEPYQVASVTQMNNRNCNQRAAVRMQMAVFVCFLFCWTPHHVARIRFLVITKSQSWDKESTSIQETIHLVAGCFYLLSSAINPFLYSLFSKRFRRGFYDLIYRGKSCTISCTTGHTTVRMIENIPKEEGMKNFAIKTKTSKELVQLTKLHNGNNGRQVITRQALYRHFNIDKHSSYYLDDDIDYPRLQRNTLRNYGKMYHGIPFSESLISNPPFYSYANGENSSKYRTRGRSRVRRLFNKSEGDDCSIVFRFSPAPSSTIQDESKSSQSEMRSKTKSSTTEGKLSIMQSSSEEKCKYKVVFNTIRGSSSDTSTCPNSNQETTLKIKNDNIQNIIVDLKYIDCSTTET